MSQFETRNPAHQWKFSRPITWCSVCNCPDMVEICAEYHEAGCKCTNPPCPPTEQERADIAVALLEVTNTKTENLAVGGFATTPVLGIVGDSHQAFWATPPSTSTSTSMKLGPPYSGLPVWELDGNITMLEQGLDLSLMQHVFKCNCKKHGDFMVKVSTDVSRVSMGKEDLCTYIGRLIVGSCQGCIASQDTRRSAIVRIADQAIGGGK